MSKYYDEDEDYKDYREELADINQANIVKHEYLRGEAKHLKEIQNDEGPNEDV